MRIKIQKMTSAKAKEVDKIRARLREGKRLSPRETQTAIKYMGVKTYLGLKAGITC
jgi:hypothetical protein